MGLLYVFVLSLTGSLQEQHRRRLLRGCHWHCLHCCWSQNRTHCFRSNGSLWTVGCANLFIPTVDFKFSWFHCSKRKLSWPCGVPAWECNSRVVGACDAPRMYGTTFRGSLKIQQFFRVLLLALSYRFGTNVQMPIGCPNAECVPEPFLLPSSPIPAITFTTPSLCSTLSSLLSWSVKAMLPSWIAEMECMCTMGMGSLWRTTVLFKVFCAVLNCQTEKPLVSARKRQFWLPRHILWTRLHLSGTNCILN